MKRYHPLGHIVSDGLEKGKVCGMIINDGVRAPKGVLAEAVGLKEFSRLVSNNEMQYFQMKENEPIVCYTKEEIRYCKMNLKNTIYKTNEEYYADDFCFNMSDVLGGRLSFSILGCKYCLNEMRVAAGVYRKTPITESEIQKCRIFTKASIARGAENFYIYIFEPKMFGYYLHNEVGIGNYGINFDTAMHNNFFYEKKIIGFKNADPSYMKEIRENILTWGE